MNKRRHMAPFFVYVYITQPFLVSGYKRSTTRLLAHRVLFNKFDQGQHKLSPYMMKMY